MLLWLPHVGLPHVELPILWLPHAELLEEASRSGRASCFQAISPCSLEPSEGFVSSLLSLLSTIFINIHSFLLFTLETNQIYHQLFLSTLPPVQVLESPSFQKVQRAEPTPAQPLNLHHLPHSLRGHAEDYLGGGEKWGAPVPRTRSPHTLKLR